jgi:ATP-dependent 26S proteasome regulatory subunit
VAEAQRWRDFKYRGAARKRTAAALTQAESTAVAKYVEGEAALVCSAAVKKARNLVAMDDGDSADAERIRMANTGNIDIARMMKRLAGD